MKVIKPPTPLPLEMDKPSIFLAGSIEMGTAENWQQRFTQALQSHSGLLLNPRRDDWDPTWLQTIENRRFREQVEWELQAQEQADLIAMYFQPQTKAPITLLELGLFAHRQKLIVCCPEGFWRKGNVDIVCERYGIPHVDHFEALLLVVQNRLLHS